MPFFAAVGAFAAFAGVIFALNYRQVHPFMGEVAQELIKRKVTAATSIGAIKKVLILILFSSELPCGTDY